MPPSWVCLPGAYPCTSFPLLFGFPCIGTSHLCPEFGRSPCWLSGRSPGHLPGTPTGILALLCRSSIGTATKQITVNTILVYERIYTPFSVVISLLLLSSRVLRKLSMECDQLKLRACEGRTVDIPLLVVYLRSCMDPTLRKHSPQPFGCGSSLWDIVCLWAGSCPGRGCASRSPPSRTHSSGQKHDLLF